MPIVICAQCNKEFSAIMAEIKRGRGKFCSVICRQESVRFCRKIINCLVCNSAIEITSKGMLGAKFCSRKCYYAYPKIAFDKKCGRCGEKIPYRIGGNQRTFCSIRCASFVTNAKRKALILSS